MGCLGSLFFFGRIPSGICYVIDVVDDYSIGRVFFCNFYISKKFLFDRPIWDCVQSELSNAFKAVLLRIRALCVLETFILLLARRKHISFIV